MIWDYNTDYNNIYKQQIFINDNQTTIQDNRTAWQMETEIKTSTVHSKWITIWTINGNVGYRFTYSGPADNYFDKYLDGFRNILHSVEFTAMHPEKRPSFLATANLTSKIGYEESNLKQENSVKIVSSNSFIDTIGSLHVVGEVENNTPDTVTFVKIIGTFYDSNNRVVATQYTYANPSTISPHQKAPFELILTSSSVPPSLIEQYKLSISN